MCVCVYHCWLLLFIVVYVESIDFIYLYCCISICHPFKICIMQKGFHLYYRKYFTCIFLSFMMITCDFFFSSFLLSDFCYIFYHGLSGFSDLMWAEWVWQAALNTSIYSERQKKRILFAAVQKGFSSFGQHRFSMNRTRLCSDCGLNCE